MDARSLAKIVRDAKKADFDNIPVLEQGNVLGYVRRKELQNGFDTGLIVAFETSRMPGDTGLLDLARRIEQDGTDPCKLYFVVDTNSAPKGILTYADLNRRTAYIFTYTMVLFLEQWVRKRIEDEYHQPGRKLGKGWTRYLVPDRKKILKEMAVERRESILSVCGLDDLVRVIRRDPRLSRQFAMLDKQALQIAQEVRPRVAHPTKLLLPKRDSQERLGRLVTFWDRMVSFVEAHDLNEKIGGWSGESQQSTARHQ